MSSTLKWVVFLLLTATGNISYLLYHISSGAETHTPAVNSTKADIITPSSFALYDAGSGSAYSLPNQDNSDSVYRERYTQTLAPWRLNLPCDCKQLLLGNEVEINKTLALNSKVLSEEIFDESRLVELTTDCIWLRKRFNDQSFYNSDFERDFPVAFSFVIHENAHQVLRLVQLLYRPQNSFCFHYDAKSSTSFKRVFNNMANCLGNVIVPSKIEDITWGTNSILNAQLNCIHDLQRQRQWKYLITLCGKELPLVSNRAIVTHLRAQYGKSVIYSTKLEEDSIEIKRLQWKGVLNNHGRLIHTKQSLGPIPFNLTAYKNMAYMALSEPFVHYLLHSDTAAALRQFLANCSNPEEHFYSMLYMQDGVPGGHDYSKTRAIVPGISGTTWIPHEDIAEYLDSGEQTLKHPLQHCHGKVIHRVCILNSGDLQHLTELLRSRRKLFYNKYFMELDTTVMSCVEEWITEQNMQEFHTDRSLV